MTDDETVWLGLTSQGGNPCSNTSCDAFVQWDDTAPFNFGMALQSIELSGIHTCLTLDGASMELQDNYNCTSDFDYICSWECEGLKKRVKV